MDDFDWTAGTAFGVRGGRGDPTSFRKGDVCGFLAAHLLHDFGCLAVHQMLFGLTG